MENDTLLKGVKIPEQGFIEVMITSAGEVVQTGKSVRYDGVDCYQPVGPELVGSAIPAVDYVPMDFHDRCMQTEIRKRHDLERFVKWVMDEIFSADWEEYRIAFDELACRKLVKLGYVAVDEENDLYYRKDEPEDE